MKYDSLIFSVFKGLLGTDDPPTKVLEVKSESYVSRPVYYRDDCMLLYGPKIPDAKNSKDKNFEIIMHKPFTDTHQMYRYKYVNTFVASV